MNKSERDKYWTELIQTCRVSGLSDYEWCRMRMVSKFSKAVNYALNQKPYMKNYLTDGRCSISNNAAERAVKSYVMERAFYSTVQ